MKPLKLTFEGFSAFMNGQEIDFARFTDNLFLIYGPTGGGKTSILDAITYALYGNSSAGNRGGLEQMRCQYAEKDVTTRVTFEFNVSGRTYRFYRELKAGKSKGETVYKEQGGAFILDEQEGLIPIIGSSNSRAITEKATEILGLDYNQFCQIIILPQGQFERFLLSGSKEKEQILSQIFDTSHFERMAVSLVERVREKEQAVLALKANLSALYSQVEVESLEEIKTKLQQDRLKLQELQQTQAKLQQTVTEKAKVLSKVNEILNHEAELEDVNSKIELVLQKQSQLRDKAQLMAACEQAARVKPCYQSFIDLDKQRNQRYSHTQCLCAELKLKQDALIHCTNQIDTLQRQNPDITDIKERLVRYNTALPYYKRYTTLKGQLEEQTDTLTLLTSTNTSLQQSHSELEKLIQAYNQTLHELEQIESITLPAAKLQRERLTAIQKKVQALSDLKQAYKQLEDRSAKKDKELEEQEREVLRCTALYQTLNQRYLQDSAYRLSANLKEGDPCPVCGSVSHPVKANATEDTVTYDEVAAALKSHDQAVTEQTKLIAKSAALRLELRHREERINELSLEEDVIAFSQDLLDRCNGEVISLIARLAEKDKLVNDTTAARLQLDKAATELASLQQTIKQAEQGIAVTNGNLIEISGSFIEGVTTHKELSNQISLLQDRVTHYDTTLTKLQQDEQEITKSINTLTVTKENSEQELLAVEKRLEQQGLQLDTEIQSHGLIDHDNLKRLLAIDEDFSLVQSTLKSLADEGVILANSKDRLTAFMAENPLSCSKEQAESEFNSATVELEDTTRQLTLLEQGIKKLSDTYNRSSGLTLELEQSVVSLDKIRVLSNAIAGARGVSLTRYLLGVMMGSVISGANDLLKQVHNGRYSLYRKVVDGAKNKKTGLELEVYDSVSGRLREVQTLSGGERFLVALSLSFGLSFAILSTSGGVSIDTIFIDEGFGSLDTGSLQDALSILSVINSGGKRLVGIISHVELLKEIIPTKLEVIKGNRGSSIRI